MILDLLDDILALGSLGIVILIVVLIFVIVIVLETFALKIGIKAVKGENTKLGPVFLTGLIMIFISAVISFVFGFFLPAWVGSIVSLLFNLFIIKARHKTSFLGALAAIIIFIIVLFIIFGILWLVFVVFLGLLTI